MAIEEFTVEVHHQAADGERRSLGRMSLLYLLKRMATALEPHTALSRRDLEDALTGAFTGAYAPQTHLPNSEDRELPLPFPLGGITPGLILDITDEGDAVRMQTMTLEQAEAMRTYLNRAQQVTSDDPGAFDSPLLLGPEPQTGGGREDR